MPPPEPSGGPLESEQANQSGRRRLVSDSNSRAIGGGRVSRNWIGTSRATMLRPDDVPGLADMSSRLAGESLLGKRVRSSYGLNDEFANSTSWRGKNDSGDQNPGSTHENETPLLDGAALGGNDFTAHWRGRRTA